MTRIFNAMVRSLAILGVVCLCLAVGLTIVDVALRRTAGVAIVGVADLTQLAVMYAVYFGIVYAFIDRSHVAVTVVTDLLGPRVKSLVSAFWWGVGIPVLCFMAYAAWQQAAMQYQFGDLSQTIGIPMSFYWAPVLIGLALSVPASLVAIWRDLTEVPDTNTPTTESF
jgi:TRAP-type C4-dicarboxylate transport system permease small subunit